MNLDPNIIRESFEVVKSIAPQVADRFYENLFQMHPEAEGLFKEVSMGKQKNKLINSLVFIVENLESDKLVPYLKNMGSRHTYYGTEDEHYGWVGGALLQTFKDFFKENWTPQLEQQWTIAYGIIADTMKEGAREKMRKSA